jgi:ABC-2 type transport system permease protein
VVVIILWIPLGLFLSLFFKPELHPAWYQVIGFFFAIWGAYLIRTMLLSVLGMITFFTTRVGAIFELFFAVELIFSGRLVPMSLMPTAIQQAAAYMPFQWTFFFPIEVLVAPMSIPQMLVGLGMQLLWIAIGWVAVRIMWKFSVRQFSAVGG